MSDIEDDVDIVPATLSEAAACAKLHAQCFADIWDAASLARLIGAEAATSFVAVTGAEHQVIGFIVAFSAVDEAEVLTLAVDPAWRRLGIGRRLVETLAEQLAEHGVTDLILEVAAGNGAARALYRTAGFAEAGRRPGYYAVAGKQPEDAIVLRRRPDSAS